MLERYVLPKQSAAELEFVPDRAWWRFAQRFNVRAQQYVPAIRLHGDHSEGLMMRWGLISAWEECRPESVPPPAVAVGDILTSPRHREPWYNGQRCIVPVAGFYAWQHTAENYRRPYFIALPDRSAFGLAGIWDRSQGEDEDVIESFSIISVRANELMREIANTSRSMPAILKRRDYATWVRGTPAEAMAAIGEYPPEGMLAYAVSPRINSVSADDPALIRPVSLN